MIQAARPRTSFIQNSTHTLVYPLKWTVYYGQSFWVCLSYDEMLQFKQSGVTLHTPGHVTGVPYCAAFTPWLTDNVDHNVRSLDGFGTFHSMVIIAGLTYGPSVADIGPSIGHCQ